MSPMGNEPGALVEFDGVWKSFGETVVLHDFNFSVERGERVALIGPSGSGKTTILRLLMTLERPERGRIRIGDEYLWHVPRKGELIAASNERRARKVSLCVGMVFQQFNLFPHMKVLRNITEAPVRALGLSRHEAERRARELLDQVGLADKVNAYPDRLSGGQQQRVAIARALAMQPEILLFDEITSALDPELVGEVLGVVRDLTVHTEMTMLFVTHEMRFAREVADRVVMFDAGQVVEQGPPSEIFTRPAHERTRAFLDAVLDHGPPAALATSAVEQAESGS